VLPTMQCDVMQCRDTIMQTEMLYVASNSDNLVTIQNTVQSDIRSLHEQLNNNSLSICDSSMRCCAQISR